MKPIVRWTFHEGVAEAGREILRMSIACWKEIYGDAWDYYLCVNRPFDGMDAYEGVEILYQSENLKHLPIPPFSTSWKFYPPRINIHTHELFLDNDVLIYDRVPTIERFIQSDEMISHQAHTRNYGQFDRIILSNMMINTGIMGVPPGYDFDRKMARLLGLYCRSRGWTSAVDDQGAFACLMLRHAHCLVSLSEVAIINPSVDFAPYEVGKYGIHFIGTNWGKDAFYRRFFEEGNDRLLPITI